jgi:hypothetical protein
MAKRAVLCDTQFQINQAKLGRTEVSHEDQIAARPGIQPAPCESRAMAEADQEESATDAWVWQ